MLISDTSVKRSDNLYRFQIEEYPNYDLMRIFKNQGRRGNFKRRKTVYDEKGRAFMASTETGEILYMRKSNEIKKSVDTSLARTRKVVREIAMANTWDWFVTLTFNNFEQDRTNDKQVKEQFSKFRKSVRKQFPNMYYLAVIERHKDGCIHFHLPVGGISAEELQLRDSGRKDKSGRTIYNCYAWKYGFSTVTEVGDSEKVAGYILKYIGKDLGVDEDFKKRYWASKNCNRPKKRFVDFLSELSFNAINFFDSLVERTITMTVQYWNSAKNYLVVKDYERGFRKMKHWFSDFYLSWHKNVWKVSNSA